MRDAYIRKDLQDRLAHQGDLFAWVNALEGDVYREVARRRTLRVVVDGRSYFAKLHFGVGWAEIVKNWLTLKSPVLGAENEYRACLHLDRMGINAPKVAAFAMEEGSPATRRSFVLCDELAGFESLQDVTDRWESAPPSPRQQRQLLMGVAAFVRRLHAAGVVHRDLYICHLLLDRDKWQRADLNLAILDLHRAEVHARMPTAWRRRDLAARLFSALDLNLHPRAWLRFVRVYTGRPLRETFTRDAAFWGSVYRRANKLYQKGLRKGLVKGRYRP
ncbi:MAG: lipopolysaccharide core heptose(I) kinase RfaP [Gammaproteobacteria bacterium]|nr:lipopolysaccharide core heptose(I) kinase RfaP [Gammaproteobacteria bacterium]